MMYGSGGGNETRREREVAGRGDYEMKRRR